MKRFLGTLRRTIQGQELIKEGDRVAVGLSGGKDSIALLYALHSFQKFAPFNFHLEAISIDPGFEGFDLSEIQEFCKKLDIPYHIERTNIKKIVFDIKKEKNPCALCANMRRGALCNIMKSKNLNVLALGHHQDDAIETFFMNLLYSGKMNVLPYKTFLTRKEVTVVRPLLDITEARVQGVINRYDLPVAHNPCPEDKNTTREFIKHKLSKVYSEIPNSKSSILAALENEDQFKLWFDKKQPNI